MDRQKIDSAKKLTLIYNWVIFFSWIYKSWNKRRQAYELSCRCLVYTFISTPPNRENSFSTLAQPITSRDLIPKRITETNAQATNYRTNCAFLLAQGYADDNKDEDSIDPTSRIIDSMTRTTTTRTPTTTKTTATPRTPKWPFQQHGKNTRTYGRNTAAEYNGHQPKNDYPPMSAHSVYKWRTLGTRESVKQTMNNMRQSNNGERKCTSDLEYASITLDSVS